MDPLVEELLGASKETNDPLVAELLERVQRDILETPSRTAEVERNIAEREDVWRNLGPGSTSELGPTGAPLMMLGGLGQRIEAGLANPAIAALQGRPKDALREAGAGLTGRRLGEFGDIGRQLGAPEPVSIAAGLAAGGVADPTNLVGGAGRIASFRASAKVGGILARRGMSRLASMIHNVPDNMKADIIADRGRAFDKKYFEQGALPVALDKIASDVTKNFYAPAQKEWEKLGKQAATIEIDPMYVQKMADDLERKYADFIKTSRDEGFVSSTIARLRKLIEPPETSTGLLLPAGTEASPQPATLKDLLEAKADLRKYAPRSKVAMEAASDISNQLARDFDIVAEANTKWQNYRLAEEAMERAGMKVDPYQGQEVVTAAQGKLLNYYTDPMASARTALLGGATDPRPSLASVYQKAGKSPNEFIEGLNEFRRTIQARQFSDRAPIGSQVAGRGIALPIGLTLSAAVGGGAAGSALGPFGMGAGAAAGGLAAAAMSSPRAFSGIWKSTLQEGNPRGTFLKELLNRRLHERMIDQAVTRQVTGRNE